MRVSRTAMCAGATAALAVPMLLAGFTTPAAASDKIATPAPAGTWLVVSVQPAPDAPARHYTLSCDPADGTHPDPAAACGTLDRVSATVFAPVPPDAVCTLNYGGPERAVVRGVWRGAPLLASFSRADGCEIARWDAMAGLL